MNTFTMAWRRNACGLGSTVLTALVGIFLSLPVGADPNSDLFQPDVFRTGAALRQRTPGLADPLGRDCGPPEGAMTLSTAIDLALCRNPTTRSAWAAARQQAAALGGAQSSWLPSVSATGEESRDFGAHADATGLITSSPQNTRDAALNLSWTLYDFGARDGRITSARH